MNKQKSTNYKFEKKDNKKVLGIVQIKKKLEH